MSGKAVKDYKKVPPGKIEVVNILNSNGYKELDEQLIQLSKNVKSKIDEAKARISEHIQNDHRDDDIYKFLAHTKRGRLLCRLFGYRNSNQRRLNFVAKKKKLATKIKQIEV